MPLAPFSACRAIAIISVGKESAPVVPTLFIAGVQPRLVVYGPLRPTFRSPFCAESTTFAAASRGPPSQGREPCAVFHCVYSHTVPQLSHGHHCQRRGTDGQQGGPGGPPCRGGFFLFLFFLFFYFFILGFSENFCRVLPARTQKGHRLNGPSEATLGKSDIGTSPECIFECPASSGRVLSSIVSTVTQFPNSAMGTTVNDGARTGSRGLQGAPPAGGGNFFIFYFYFLFFILGFSEKTNPIEPEVRAVELRSSSSGTAGFPRFPSFSRVFPRHSPYFAYVRVASPWPRAAVFMRRLAASSAPAGS